MVIQDLIWMLTLLGIGLIALGFTYVIRQASKPADKAGLRQVAHRSNVLRRWLFGALLSAFVAGSYVTLHNFPIVPQFGSLGATQVVNVTGGQWYWLIEPDTVQAGSPVEFRVTSKDVNHGFALYAADDRIINQTQAMPGYTNKLLHTFSEPGTYQIMCLEFCGVAHATMTAQLQVVSTTGD